MVRRAGLTIMVLLGIWILVGCSMADREGKTMDKTEKSAVDSNGQNAADQDAAEMIRELLGCSLRTAQSIEKQCHMAGIGGNPGGRKDGRRLHNTGTGHRG